MQGFLYWIIFTFPSVKEFRVSVLTAATTMVGRMRCSEAARNATSATSCSLQHWRGDTGIPHSWVASRDTPWLSWRERLGPSWCRAVFRARSSHCRWLTLVWMTPVPSITRPWCHRWRSNNRPHYPALHTWLSSAHCSPTNLQDGWFCAGSPGRGAGWAQVVARACPSLLHQRYSGKGCHWEGAVGRSLHAGAGASASREGCN